MARVVPTPQGSGPKGDELGGHLLFVLRAVNGDANFEALRRDLISWRTPGWASCKNCFAPGNDGDSSVVLSLSTA